MATLALKDLQAAGEADPKSPSVHYMRSRVLAEMGTRKSALLVPQRAVTELQGSYQLAVVGGDNKVNLRPVKVGRIDRP